MNIPDYISPIVGHRVWQWFDDGLRSLNGEPWAPGKPLEASCRVLSPEGVRLAHHAPQAKCMCGVYAAKEMPHLQQKGYIRWGICGEVSLWGRVVEHTRGWRAEFGYPKSFSLGSDDLPFTIFAIQARLATLTPYGADIFVVGSDAHLLLWSAQGGYEQAGLDYLVEIRKQQYQRKRRVLKRGDRVAILGKGVGIVKTIFDGLVCVAFCSQKFVEMPRSRVVWNDVNMRWEATQSGAFERSASTQPVVKTHGR